MKHATLPPPLALDDQFRHVSIGEFKKEPFVVPFIYVDSKDLFQFVEDHFLISARVGFSFLLAVNIYEASLEEIFLLNIYRLSYQNASFLGVYLGSS